MDISQLNEIQNTLEETPKGTDNGLRTPTVALVEMGAVSVETKGIHSGLELGFTPRN